MLTTLVANRILIQTILGLILLTTLLWLGIFWGWYTLVSVLSLIPYFIITAMAGWIFFNIGEEIKNTLRKKDTETKEKPSYKPLPTFDKLEIHFLKEKESDTPMTSRLRYLVDTTKGKAHLIREVPDWLKPLIEGQYIIWFPYDEQKNLKRAFYQSKLEVITDSALSPWAVGLKYVDGALQKENLFADLLTTIGKNKIDNLLIARLERKYFFSIQRRALLVDFSDKKIWLAPLCWNDLVQNANISYETYGMKWRERCKDWAKRWSIEEYGQEFKFIPNRYPDSLLIDKSLTKETTCVT